MENTLNKGPKKERDVFYYRQRLKNRVFTKIISFFAEEAERTGITKRDIATILNRDPAQITRWLSSPSNMTLDTISDLLLALEAEIDPPPIVRFTDRAISNYAHPLVARITGAISNPKNKPLPVIEAESSYKAIAPVKIEPPQSGKVLNLSLVG